MIFGQISLASHSISLQDHPRTHRIVVAFVDHDEGTRGVRLAYFFGAGGLLVRPPPDLWPSLVLAGQFGVLLLMVFLR